jgi:uracil-DNA glycosylase
MRAVLVGEAYGRHEAQFQHALVGPSGRELTLEMGIAALAPYMKVLCRRCKTNTEFIDGFCRHCRERIWPNEFDLMEHWKLLRSDLKIAVTNVFNTQPPNNDLGNFFGYEAQTEMPGWKASRKTGGSHLLAEHFHHLKRLWNELEELDPNLIVCLGNAACWAVLGQTKITALRGTVTFSERLKKKVLPTFHPAAVLRQTPMRVSVIADLQKASREIEFPEIVRPKRWITIPAPNESGLIEIQEWLARNAFSYSNDIETIRNQISVIGFSLSNSDALAIPFRDAKMDKGKIVDVGKIAASIGFPDNGINYWPTSELEVKAWSLAKAGVESNKGKIYQNGVFDISYFLQMGIIPRNVKDDTMLWHHSEYLELPKSLGFLGSIYANDIPWKQMSRSESLKRDE